MSLETHAAIYFYGVKDPAYGFLSNFYACRFTDSQRNTFQSSEQFFMKRKQEVFDPTNETIALAILRAKTPPEAKRLGRRVGNYDDGIWSMLRFTVMVDALKLKFGSDQELARKLLATGEKKLYEASHQDAIWGIGLSVARVQAMFRESAEALEWTIQKEDHSEGTATTTATTSEPDFFMAGDVDEATQQRCYGENLLGKALMETRTWLQIMKAASEATQRNEGMGGAGLHLTKPVTL